MFTIQLVDIAIHHEIAVFCRKFCLCHTFNQFLMFFSVSLDLRNCTDLQIMFFCKCQQIISSCHCAVIFHDFTAKTNFLESRHLHQINRHFCMSRTLKDTALFSNQWEHMPRSSEIFRFCTIFNNLHGCHGSLKSRNTCRCVFIINGFCKCCSMVICINGAHHVQAKLFYIINMHRHTDQAFCIRCHKVDILRCCKFSRTDDIPFIFSILIVHNNNNLAATNSFDDFFY